MSKCNIGKSCGASCVQRTKKCSVELEKQQSSNVKEAVRKIGSQREKLLPRAQSAPSVKRNEESPESEWNYLTQAEYDEKLKTKQLKRIGNSTFEEWADSATYKTAEGSFARVYVNSDGKFVKRGIITDQEAVILQKVGSKDMGPMLVAADVNGTVNNSELKPISHLGLRHGRIAMTRVPGKDMEETMAEQGAFGPSSPLYGIPAADVYWKAMANLHRLGVAHNDAHPGNLFVGTKTGKGRWVDFGLSQDSPKAALTEALGSFITPAIFSNTEYRKHLAEDSAGAADPTNSPSGNWQTRSWLVTGTKRVDSISGKLDKDKLKQDCPVLSRIWSNVSRVNKLLKEKYGLNEGEIAAIYAHGIRSPLLSYEQGPWRKLSDKDAEYLISVLYKGV